MDHTTTTSLSAVKFEVIVQDNGRISVNVPFLPGKKVIVFVVQEQDTEEALNDLTRASTSSTDFWNNPYDDEDWNNA